MVFEAIALLVGVSNCQFSKFLITSCTILLFIDFKERRNRLLSQNKSETEEPPLDSGYKQILAAVFPSIPEFGYIQI
jgi:hypothetical protein